MRFAPQCSTAFFSASPDPCRTYRGLWAWSLPHPDISAERLHDPLRYREIRGASFGQTIGVLLEPPPIAGAPTVIFGRVPDFQEWAGLKGLKFDLNRLVIAADSHNQKTKLMPLSNRPELRQPKKPRNRNDAAETKPAKSNNPPPHPSHILLSYCQSLSFHPFRLCPSRFPH